LSSPDSPVRADESTLFRRAGIGLLVGVFLAVVVFAAHPLTNPDTFFHLRFGEEFLSGWAPWDPGTVTSIGTADWVPTQWLSQVVMAAVERAFGLAGVAWLFGTAVLGYAYVVYRACRRTVPAAVATFLVIVTLAASAQGLSARPQILSYLFVVITVDAWLRTADDGRRRWWLVPMTWLWVLCHGMWPIGVLIGLVAVGGLAVERRGRGEVLRLLAIPAASALAAAVTPVGPRVYAAVLEVGGRSKYFWEWGAPHFDEPAGATAALMVGVLVLLGLLAARVRPTHALLILLVLGALLYSYRTTPVAAAVAAPLIARLAQPHLPRAGSPTRRESMTVVAAAALASGLLAALAAAAVPDRPELPDWVDSEMAALPTGTRVLNQDLFGGPLMWLHPDVDFLYSGYGDVYPTAALEQRKDLEELQPGWEETVTELQARIALLPDDSSLAYALQHSLHWRVVHDSDDVVMLVAP